MTPIKEYVEKRKTEIKAEVEKLENPPKLVVVQVGDDPASCSYIKGKLKDCAEVKIPCEHVHLEETIDTDDLLLLIDQYNHDSTVTGFIVQLPLPKHINVEKIIDAISPEKDVDGFSKRTLVNPATPQGILDYLESEHFDFEDSNAVVIGRSNIVGKPMARMLLEKNCNIRVIHSKTSYINKRRALTDADLVVVATGHRNTLVDTEIETTMKPNGIIIDVGVNRNEEGKLCGDCEHITCREKTPVPGGCGLLTRLALLTNLLKLYKINNNIC